MAATFDRQQAEHFRVHVSGYRFLHPPASSVPAKVPLETIKHSVQNCLVQLRRFPSTITVHEFRPHMFPVLTRNASGESRQKVTAIQFRTLAAQSPYFQENFMQYVRVAFFNVNVAVPKKLNRHVGKRTGPSPTGPCRSTCRVRRTSDFWRPSCCRHLWSWPRRIPWKDLLVKTLFSSHGTWKQTSTLELQRVRFSFLNLVSNSHSKN